MTKPMPIFNDRVFTDESIARWGIPTELAKFGQTFGELIAVFQTKENSRVGHLSERWCFEDKTLESLGYVAGEGYALARYITETSFAGKIAPVCAINPTNGKVKFLKDLQSEALAFSRPQQVQYMRITKEEQR